VEDWSRVVAEHCGSALLLGPCLGEMSQAQGASSRENQHLEPFFVQPGQYGAHQTRQVEE